MKLVILDRDGVINHDSPDYIKSADEWIPLPGSMEAIARLNHYGYKVVVATNQSGLARNLFNAKDLNSIHKKFRSELDKVGGQIEGIFVCPHGPDDQCECRKPKPGLLLQIRDRMGVDLESSFFVGDSLRDIEAGRLVGAQNILVKTGNGKNTLKHNSESLGDVRVVEDLSDAADFIVNSSQ